MGADAQVAVGVKQRDDAVNRAVMSREDLEDAVQRGFQVERAGERLTHLEKR